MRRLWSCLSRWFFGRRYDVYLDQHGALTVEPALTDGATVTVCYEFGTPLPPRRVKLATVQTRRRRIEISVTAGRTVL